MADSTFELPFGWDDGKFVSPFVTSGPESTLQLVEILQDVALCGPLATLQKCRIVDLGCGDGTVLHAAVTNISWLSAVGYDLDESLIAKAQAQFGSDDRLRFEVADFVDSFESIASRTDVVFAYLLPEALEILRPGVLKATSHWGGAASGAAASPIQCIISNRWDIPYLEPFLVSSVGHLNVYTNPSWRVAGGSV